jgi:hypothetical protein
MRRKMFWRAGIVAAVTFGGCLGMSVGELGLLGVSPAEAKAYYTRKRVNGRWITGRFAKRGGGLPGVATEQSEAPGIKVSAVRPTLTSPAPVASTSRPEPAAPAKRLDPQSPTAPLAQAPLISPAANARVVSDPEADRLGKLRQALQARASALTAGRFVEVARPAPEPQSVSLDFKSGMKTTLFSDGTSVTEPFDTTALKGLAAAPGEAKAGR